MATKKKPARKKPAVRPTPMLAAEKEASAAGIAATVASVDANASSVASRTRGAFGRRRLRQSGTELSRYDLGGGYSDDPFPKLPTPPGGGGQGGGGTRKRGTVRKPPRKPLDLHDRDQMKREGKRQQKRISDGRAAANEAERKRRAAQTAREREAARKAAARKAKARGQKGGRTRTPAPPKSTVPVPGAGGRARPE